MGPHRCQILGKLRELPSRGNFQDVSERHSTIIRYAGTGQVDGNSGRAKAIVLHIGQSGGGINNSNPRSPARKRLIHTSTHLSAIRVLWRGADATPVVAQLACPALQTQPFSTHPSRFTPPAGGMSCALWPHHSARDPD